MNKKLLRVFGVMATVGVISSQAYAIDLSGVGGLLDLATSGLGLLCGESPVSGPVNPLNPTEATTIKNTGSFLCDASKIFDTANKAATSYKEFQNKINGATTTDFLKAGMVFALNPKAREDMTAKVGSIFSANGVDGVSTAVDGVRTEIESAFKGKSSKDRDLVQEELQRLRTAVFGGTTITKGQAQVLDKTVSAVTGVNINSSGLVNAQNAQLAEQKVNALGTSTVSGKVATDGFKENTETSRDNQSQSLNASKKMLQESDQAVSTRATIQVTNKLLANIMLAQSNQSANLISALQKLSTQSALTAQQMGEQAQHIYDTKVAENNTSELIKKEIDQNRDVLLAVNDAQIKAFSAALNPTGEGKVTVGGTVQTASNSGNTGQPMANVNQPMMAANTSYWGGDASLGVCNPLEDLAKYANNGKLLNCTGTIKTSELGQYKDAQGKICDPRYDEGSYCEKPLPPAPAGTKYVWLDSKGNPCDPTLEGGAPCKQVAVPTTPTTKPTSGPLF